jgi:hypothetical protein
LNIPIFSSVAAMYPAVAQRAQDSKFRQRGMDVKRGIRAIAV